MNKSPSKKFLIRDIPSIRKYLETVHTLQQLKTAMPLLRPLLKRLDVQVEEISNALLNVDDLAHKAEELASIPDRFNELFSARGWIVFDRLDINVAKDAIAQAEAGDIDGAEKNLVAYYSPDTVQWQIRAMMRIQAFRPRMRLAELALIDYQEERYHACIPVVLSLLDGLVNELHKPKQGFFSEGINLEAWDSIAAHSKGLQVLSVMLAKGRDKTRTETISIPYRNGILHGMDLGYDNQMVAAKTWGALFAVGDWAVRAEKGYLTAPQETSEKSWEEIYQEIQEIEEDKKRLSGWKPRSMQPGVDLPITGEPEAFTEGTPERRLVEFLSLWKNRNYGFMAKYIPKIMGYSPKVAPARVHDMFSRKHLKSYELTRIKDEGPAITEIDVKLVYEVGGNDVERTSTIRMMNEDAKGDPVTSGKPGSCWMVMGWMIP